MVSARAANSTFDLARQLGKGDTVDFAVGFGQNGNYNSDLTGLNLNVTLSGVFDAKSDFSPQNNPSGPWTYGYRASLGSPFISFTDAFKRNALDYWARSSLGPDPNIGHNPDKFPRFLSEIVFPPNELVFHPGPSGEYSVLRWTAPTAGQYFLQSSFVGEGGKSTVDLHILQKGSSIFDTSINGRTKRSSFSSIITVAIGDTIEFTVGYGSDRNYDSDTTGIDVQFRRLTEVSGNRSVDPSRGGVGLVHYAGSGLSNSVG